MHVLGIFSVSVQLVTGGLIALDTTFGSQEFQIVWTFNLLSKWTDCFGHEIWFELIDLDYLLINKNREVTIMMMLVDFSSQLWIGC